MGAKIIEPPTGSELRDASTDDAIASANRSPSDAREDHAEAVAPAGPPKSLPREYFESAVVTIIMALFGMTFIVQAVKVPTGSMQNTINIGDQLLVNKFIFAPGPVLPFLPQREVRRGDVAVFKYPGNPKDPSRDSDPDNIPFRTNYVKRIIGMPGDRIEIHGENIFVNGQLLPERHATGRNFYEDDPRTPYVNERHSPVDVLDEPPPTGEGSYTALFKTETRLSSNQSLDGETNDIEYSDGEALIVPAGKYLAVGDNRDNSSDGRVWGFVDRDLIVGRAMMVYWSYDLSDESGGNPVARFFRNTRWERTGTMIR